MNKGTIRWHQGGSRGIESRSVTGAEVTSDEDGEYTYLRAYEECGENPRRRQATEEWRILTRNVIDVHTETVKSEGAK